MIRVEIWPEFNDLDKEGKRTDQPESFTGWVVTETIIAGYTRRDLGRFDPGQFVAAEQLARDYACEHHGEVY